jgi:hypothetical protein
MSASEQKTASWLAGRIYEWGRAANALAASSGSRTGADLLQFLGLPGDSRFTEIGNRLRRLKIVTVASDDQVGHVAVMVKNQVKEADERGLPKLLFGNSVEYVGHANIPEFPATPLPQSATLGGSRFWAPDGRFACGSSITAAPIHSAGTMGALVRKPDGKLYGLTNNHVTGGCNHTELGMFVMCPANIDAAVGQVPPTAIGLHDSLTMLRSGDPGQQDKQRLDAALFEIIDENRVTSWQGNRSYDTPVAVAAPSANMRVRKIGRTSGETRGRITGEVASKLVIPYKSDKLSGDVHYEGLWMVAGIAGEEFSTFGDSGSLVVSEDQSTAVGLVLGGQQGITYIMRITDVLTHFGATLVGSHNR